MYRFEDLSQANFSPLLSLIWDDCECWSLLNLSLGARVNLVKINILPCFSYLFQCVPTFLPQVIFHKVDFLVPEFVWSKKVPGLCRQYLQRPRKPGGLALPNFRFYYWASNIRILKYWLQYEASHSHLTWLAMKPLFTFLFSPLFHHIPRICLSRPLSEFGLILMLLCLSDSLCLCPTGC